MLVKILLESITEISDQRSDILRDELFEKIQIVIYKTAKIWNKT